MKQSIAILLAFGIIFISNPALGKKVKFAVDMTGTTVSVNGIHISGDFQVAAGYASNWCSACTKLTNQTGTEIYSIVVDIPAFKKYEYKFVNGDLFYEVEIVPEESRIGYDFNDNRWIYVDSLANDTTFVGAIVFGQNAPQGSNLVRYKVDMKGTTVSSKGVHLGSSLSSFDYQNHILCNLWGKIWEVIEYVPAGAIAYKFANGNSATDAETVPANCANSGYRGLMISKDTVLEYVCYASCSRCSSVGVDQSFALNSFSLFPNPCKGQFSVMVDSKIASDFKFTLVDLFGREVSATLIPSENLLQISGLLPGVYFLNFANTLTGKNSAIKIISL